MENFINKSVDIIVFVVYNRGIIIKRKDKMDSEIDKSLENKNLSEAQKTVQEIAKECGLKRMI